MFYGFSEEIIRRIRDGELEDERLNHLLQGAGISFDKLRLLRGESTNNNAIAVTILWPEEMHED